jgi:hypothetical protein
MLAVNGAPIGGKFWIRKKTEKAFELPGGRTASFKVKPQSAAGI